MDIKKVLKRLGIKDKGTYDNQFYVIDLQDSDEYAAMYTQLSDTAINTEEPSITANTNGTTVKIVNYFEIEEDSIIYNIFLMADFANDRYYIKIGEK